MTNIELEVAHSTRIKNKVIVDKLTKIDWEQRRFEIAKSVMSARISASSVFPDEDELASIACRYADALVKQLKAKQNLIP